MKWAADPRFYNTLDAAGELTFDALIELRAANVSALPPPHSELLAFAIAALEGVQTNLFHLRNGTLEMRQLELA